MKPLLISGFCSVKWIRPFMDGTLTYRRLAPSRCWYSFTTPRVWKAELAEYTPVEKKVA